MSTELQYLALLSDLLERGEKRPSRAGPTRGLFNAELVFTSDEGLSIPLLTVRPISFKVAWAELVMFLKGQTHSPSSLEDKGITIWKGNTTATQGDLGPMYGYQWRHFGGTYRAHDDNEPGIDTFSQLIQTLITTPDSRRLVLSTLNMAQAGQGVLWPCHGLTIQFYVSELQAFSDGKRFGVLSVKQTQRSADVYHGLPYNLVSYTLLMFVVIQLVHDLTQGQFLLLPGKVITSLGDVHLYENHVPAATALLTRTLGLCHPHVEWKRTKPLLSVDDLEMDDLVLVPGTYLPNRGALPDAPFNP